MDKARKKELLEQYKQMKPPMGVFIIKCKINNKCYIQGANDFRSSMNGAKVRLDGGFHPNQELQKEWNEYGCDNFSIEILENLEYDEDEGKIDYKDDLSLLQMIWEDKLAKQNIQLYKKRFS